MGGASGVPNHRKCDKIAPLRTPQKDKIVFQEDRIGKLDKDVLEQAIVKWCDLTCSLTTDEISVPPKKVMSMDHYRELVTIGNSEGFLLEPRGC